MNLHKETITREPEVYPPVAPEETYRQMSQLSAKSVELFVPQDAPEQKQLFLEGSIRNPNHTYTRLENTSSEEDGQIVRDLTESLASYAETDPVKYLIYEQYAHRNVLTHDFVVAARDTHSLDEDVANNARKRFMEINIELNGAPDRATFDALISETKQSIDQKNLSPEATQIRNELFSLLPETDSQSERFIPSDETVKKMRDIAEYLYGGMLSHVPSDKEIFSPEEVAGVFREIIRDEFEGVADDWKVVVVKAASISVSAGDKMVKVPENRDPMTAKTLRGLVAHELGVHMLRSITGEGTDLPLLSTGLSDYYDAEEGLGKVMEQAVGSGYQDSGIPYYQTAGLMYFGDMDFRDTHEAMWRIKLLKSIKEDAVPTEADISTAKADTYKTVMRIARGTDNLPWFKDLAYYNGSAKMWEYCETSSDDPEQFMFLLMGKSDATNPAHRRALLETRTL